MAKEIYLDFASTTEVDKRVLKEIESAMTDYYANPSSKHDKGKEIKSKIESSREKIASFIGAKSKEIVFTSGGTESNNLVLIGLAKANPEKRHIITSKIEHPSILESCKELEHEGYKIDYVNVDKEGIVVIGEIINKIRDDTLVVSIMHVNNDIGTIQPIEEIGKICKDKKVYFHSDMVQSLGKIKIDVKNQNVGLASFSGHKIHGPKGIGFLYVREGVKIKPIILGGGQENNVRSGTENSPGILGISRCLDIKVNWNKVKDSRDKIIDGLKKIPKCIINGSIKNRVQGNINASFYGIEGLGLLDRLSEKGIYASAGSACSSKKLEESHVLKALGVDEMYIHGSIRLSFEELSDKDIKFILTKISESVKELRELSPFKI